MYISPASFYLHKLMENVGDLKTFTTFYCDDIIVFSKMIEDHWLHLEKVFKQLHDAWLPINKHIKMSICEN